METLLTFIMLLKKIDAFSNLFFLTFIIKKMNNIIYKDGLGNPYDNKGNRILDIQREIDNKMYPIENVTNFDIYVDWKPLVKQTKERKNLSAERPQTDDKKGSYNHHKDVEKGQLFFPVE
jgi:hypothetical protein